MARPPTASEQKAAMLRRYNDKLARTLAQARANNVEEARRKANEDRGCVSPLGGQAV